MRTPANGNLPDRQTLYDQVWDKPLSHLATDYDVKLWDIQTWCKQLHIPLPDRAYWSRQRHGLPVEKLPLPAFTGTLEVNISRPIIPAEEPIHFANETGLSFKVPDRLNAPDSITIDAKPGLETDRMDEHFVNTEDGQFPIRVSKSSVGRILRILDTLVKCWKRRGYRIELHDRQAFIWIREIRQRVSLWEISKADPRTRPGERKKMLPTGKLAMRMDWWGGRTWRDSSNTLEEQIQSILDHMERSARQLERERESPVKTSFTTVIIEPEKETPRPPAPAKEQKAAHSQQPSPVTPTLPDQRPITSSAQEPSPIDTLIADALLWKNLKTVDEYLNALQLAHPHTAEFLQWLENAKAIRKASDPLLKKLIES